MCNFIYQMQLRAFTRTWAAFIWWSQKQQTSASSCWLRHHSHRYLASRYENIMHRNHEIGSTLWNRTISMKSTNHTSSWFKQLDTKVCSMGNILSEICTEIVCSKPYMPSKCCLIHVNQFVVLLKSMPQNFLEFTYHIYNECSNIIIFLLLRRYLILFITHFSNVHMFSGMPR